MTILYSVAIENKALMYYLEL